MSVVVGYHHTSWAIIIGDSRVTRQSDSAVSDSLQKVITINEEIILGYATNNVQIALEVIEEFKRTQEGKSGPIRLLDLKEEISRLCLGKIKNPSDATDFLLATRTSGKINMFTCKWLDNFEPFDVQETFEVIGSGAGIEDELEDKKEEIYKSEKGDHYKQKLVIHQVQNATSKAHVVGPAVGGMLQVYLVNTAGIHPIRTGQFSVEPERGFSLEMENENGTWHQRNLTTGKEVEVLTPDKVVKGFKEEVFDLKRPYDPPTREVYLLFFVTSGNYRSRPGDRNFLTPYHAFKLKELPGEAALPMHWALRSVSGNFQMSLVIKDAEGVIVKEETETVESRDPTTAKYFSRNVVFLCEKTGLYFFELYVNLKLLSRKEILIKKESDDLGKDTLRDEAKKTGDLVVEKGFIDVDFFEICKEFTEDDSGMLFEQVVFGIVTHKFPFVLEESLITLSFRAAIGLHRVTLLLNDIQEHTSRIILDTMIESKDVFEYIRIQGRIPIIFTHEGPYRLDLLVDGELQTTKLILVDTLQKPRMFNLLKEQKEDALKNNLFLLLPEDAQLLGENL